MITLEDIIKVSHLKKYFKEIKAVDDISFRVKKGELYGFLGVNGAGKSTTINILCTLLKSAEGEVQVCGHKLGVNDRDIRKRIGVVFQDNTLDSHLTVKENLITRAALYQDNRKELQKNLKWVIDILDIGETLNRQFRKLSGGQKRRCEIAKSLMNQPEILFLDEPTTGLDPQSRQNVWQCLEELRKEKQMTIFLTTHYMEEAARANYISIMDAGKLVADGTPTRLKEQYTHDSLRLNTDQTEEIIKYLELRELSYKEKSNHIEVIIPNTLYALQILNETQNHLKSFEVIQGSMDNVFLNITGKHL